MGKANDAVEPPFCGFEFTFVVHVKSPHEVDEKIGLPTEPVDLWVPS